MTELEAKLEQYFCDQCELQGWQAWKVKIIGKRGHPDRYVMSGDGRAFYCELKRQRTGVLAKQQELRHAELLAMGFTTHIIDNRADVDRVIEQECRKCLPKNI